MIEIEKLTYRYGLAEPVLRSLSTIILGTAPLAIMGQNGSGKTTLVKHFNGLLKASKGRVLIEGVDVTTQSVAEWSKKVGIVFQNPEDQLFLETVEKEVRFGPEKIGLSAKEIDGTVAKSLALTGLSDHSQTHPFELSQTDKKFCGIATVLAMNPDIYIFDEPTMGQDARGKQRLAKIIQHLETEGKLVMMISHDIPFVCQQFKRVMVLEKGRILIEGGTHYVMSQHVLLEQAQISLPEITMMAQSAGLSPYLTVAELLADKLLVQGGVSE